MLGPYGDGTLLGAYVSPALVGSIDGATDSATDGTLVGAIDGADGGALLGAYVDGLWPDALVGALLGLRVGALVGALLGALNESVVGDAVLTGLFPHATHVPDSVGQLPHVLHSQAVSSSQLLQSQ